MRRFFPVLLVLLFIVLGSVWVYMDSFQTLDLHMSDGLTVGIYKSNNNHNNPGDYDQNAKVKTLSRSGNYKIKKGQYVAVSQSTDYAQLIVPFDLSQTATTVSIYPTFTKAKLEDLLKSEAVPIRQAINEKYPKLDSAYMQQSPKLYEKGDWFAEKLVSRNPSSPNGDSLVLLLHKVGGIWIIVDSPPQIILSVDSYPGVPKSVLSDVNNFL